MVEPFKISQEFEARRTGISQVLERSLKEQKFTPSQGQLEIITHLAEALARPSDGQSVISIRGISGSGKTTLLDVLKTPLAELEVEVTEDYVEPQQFLRDHPSVKTIISTVQPYYQIPGEDQETVINHKGFTLEEMQTQLPQLIDQIVDSDEKEYAASGIDELARYSFGSMVLARRFLLERVFTNSIALTSIAASFLLKQFPALRTVVEDPMEIDEKLDDACQMLTPYLVLPDEYLLPSNGKPSYNRGVFRGILYQGHRLLIGIEKDNSALDRFLSRPPVENIPFAFRAGNSRLIYERWLHREHEVDGERFAIIRITAPWLSKQDFDTIARTFGIYTDKYPFEALPEQVPSEFGIRAAIKDDYVRKGKLTPFGFRKSFMIAGVPTGEDKRFRLFRAFWNTLENNPEQNESTPFITLLIEQNESRARNMSNMPFVTFLSSDHSLCIEPMVRLGISLETLLQQLDIPYFVAYSLRDITNQYAGDYIYNPRTQAMESVEEGRIYSLEELRK